MQKRIYAVSTSKGTRLVNAINPSQAIRHVSKSEVSCSIPGQHELVEFLTVDKLVVEEATANQDQQQLPIAPPGFTFNPDALPVAE